VSDINLIDIDNIPRSPGVSVSNWQCQLPDKCLQISLPISLMMSSLFMDNLNICESSPIIKQWALTANPVLVRRHLSFAAFTRPA
jgi:hypothetical protein